MDEPDQVPDRVNHVESKASLRLRRANSANRLLTRQVGDLIATNEHLMHVILAYRVQLAHLIKLLAEAIEQRNRAMKGKQHED